MEKIQYCENCKQKVMLKNKVSWPIIIVSLCIFWPATLIYIAYKMSSPTYVCPICGMEMEEEI